MYGVLDRPIAADTRGRRQIFAIALQLRSRMRGRCQLVCQKCMCILSGNCCLLRIHRFVRYSVRYYRVRFAQTARRLPPSYWPAPPRKLPSRNRCRIHPRRSRNNSTTMAYSLAADRMPVGFRGGQMYGGKWNIVEDIGSKRLPSMPQQSSQSGVILAAQCQRQPPLPRPIHLRSVDLCAIRKRLKFLLRHPRPASVIIAPAGETDQLVLTRSKSCPC